MRGLPLAALLAAVLSCTAVHAAEPLTTSQQHVEKAGNIVRVAIPVAALAAALLLEPQQQNPEQRQFTSLLMGGSPVHDLALGLGRAWVATGVLKLTVHETRPNGGSHSFPSGHASTAFAGAEFIRKEYGWGWGTPAYLAAGFVAWSRVEAKQHYTRDVLAGAAIGVLANHDFWRVHTRAGELAFAPSVLESGHHAVPGFGFAMNLR
jgi:PAP2 superfamily